MLVLGVGGGMGWLLPQSWWCKWTPFGLYFGLFAKGFPGSALVWGHFSDAGRRREGSGKSAFARGLQSWLDSRPNGPGRSGRVCVLSEKSLLIGTTQWGTGHSSCSLLLCGGVQWDLRWGTGSIIFLLIRFRIFLPAPPNTEQTSATGPPRQFSFANPGGGLT